MNVHRELRHLLVAAERVGWRIEERKRHVLIVSPAGDRTTLPRAGHHGPRAMLNYRAQLRRAGLNV